MASTSSRLLSAAALAALGAVALRPPGPAERILDLALSPLRVVGELAAPLAWLRAPSVRAAERALEERKAAELEQRLRLRADEERFALPARADLGAGRSFLHAEAVARPRGRFDSLVVRPSPRQIGRVQVGMPVVHGDAFVGRVERVDAEQGRVQVALVTRRDFRVGAVLEPEGEPAGGAGVLMVVGGLAVSPRQKGPLDIALAVRNPSARKLARGLVCVDERLSGAEPYAREARGYELGRLRPLQELGDSVTYAVDPRVDYKAGLFRVAIVGPAGWFQGEPSAEEDVLLGPDWIHARVIAAGDPSRRREGLKLGAGTRNGARQGAAVVFGARLIGRVSRAAPLWTDVALCGDPGLSVPGLARVDGLDRPLELGRLVSLGRVSDSSPRVRFLWEAFQASEILQAPGGDEPLRALVFTGSGEELVPPGLVLGACLLPRALGPVVIEIDQGVDVRDLARAWVRVERGRAREAARP